jgi:peptidoglycan hydrolase CwlO-like protein
MATLNERTANIGAHLHRLGDEIIGVSNEPSFGQTVEILQVLITIKDDMKLMQTDVKAIQGDVEAMKGDVKKIQDGMKTMKADIKDLQTLVGKMDINITKE